MPPFALSSPPLTGWQRGDSGAATGWPWGDTALRGPAGVGTAPCPGALMQCRCAPRGSRTSLKRLGGGTAPGSSAVVPRCLPPRTPAEARLYRGLDHGAPRPSPNGLRAAPLAPRRSTGGARKRLPGAAGRRRAAGPGRAPSGFPGRSPQRRPPASGQQRPPSRKIRTNGDLFFFSSFLFSRL